MPAKLVNLFQFCEFKIFPQGKTQIFVPRSADIDRVRMGLNIIDMRPEQEAALRQTRNGYACMLKRKEFNRPEALLAIEKITIGHAQRQVKDPRPAIAFYQHQRPDAKEKNDLDQPEKQVDPGQLPEYIPAGQHQDKNIERNEQLTPEKKRRQFLAAKITNGMD